MNNDQELSFVESQTIPWGGTYALADAIEKGDVREIESAIEECDPEKRTCLYRIAARLIKQIHS